jgi:hypothetical protein
MANRRITIEFNETDPGYISSYDRKRFDADGKSTRIEIFTSSGTDETGGGQNTWENKCGHITADEAAKIVRNFVNNSSDTKKKFIFKGLKSGIFNQAAEDDNNQE